MHSAYARPACLCFVSSWIKICVNVKNTFLTLGSIASAIPDMTWGRTLTSLTVTVSLTIQLLPLRTLFLLHVMSPLISPLLIISPLALSWWIRHRRFSNLDWFNSHYNAMQCIPCLIWIWTLDSVVLLMICTPDCTGCAHCSLTFHIQV